MGAQGLYAQNPGPQAQQDTSQKRIQIIYAEQLSFEKRGDLIVQKLIGQVALRQDSTYFYCDSAYNFDSENRFEAYSRVKVVMADSIQLTGDELHYDATTRVAEVYDNITLTDSTLVLMTDRLTYYRDEAYGKFAEGGTLKDTTNTLTSVYGYYFPRQDMAYFKEDVYLTNPDYELEADSLGYQTETRVAIFLAPTLIKSDRGEMQTSSGSYDTRNKLVHLTSRSIVKDSSYTLTADTLDYNDSTKIGIALGNVVVEQADSSLKVLGQRGIFNRIRKESTITEDAVAIQWMDEDTLYMFADTLYTIEDSAGARTFKAYPKVSFFMLDIQGRADSLVYLYDDSVLYLYTDPVIWSAENQLTGDTIEIYLQDEQADSMWVGKNGFLISEEDTVGFNQIKGKEIRANFADNKLSRMHIIGNSESIYFSKNEEGKYEGMNQALSQEIKIFLKDNQAEKIVFIAQPEGKFYPMYEILFKENRLEGMKWRIEERPTKPPLGTDGLPLPRSSKPEQPEPPTVAKDEAE